MNEKALLEKMKQWESMRGKRLTTVRLTCGAVGEIVTDQMVEPKIGSWKTITLADGEKKTGTISSLIRFEEWGEIH